MGDKNVLANNAKNSADYKKDAMDPAEKENLMTALAKEREAFGHEDPSPVDRYNLVYLIMLLHGVGTLMPWNMFITATAYFIDYKLNPNQGSTDDIFNNGTMNATSMPDHDMDSASRIYRNYFLNALGFVAQVPNVILNFINLFFQCGGGGNITKRIVWSIIVVVVMFIITIALAMVDTSNHIEAFFWITMISVVIINMANGVYQNSVYGTAACLPMKYTNAVVLGSNISGTLTSVLVIVAIASTPDPRTSGIYYFLAAIFILLVAFDTYFALPLIPFYRYYSKRAEKHGEAEMADGPRRPPFLAIFKKCWVHHLSVWFVFFVTLTCFPAIQAGVQKSNSSFKIPDKYYTPITCFLFFNAFAMLGNVFSEFVRLPGPRFVWIPVLLRGLFIPFFMFCNFQPKEGYRMLPVLIPNDYIYMVGGITMAFTSGYYSSLTMMYSPQNVEPHQQGIAGMMAAFFLVFGILCGVAFSLPVTLFIERVG